MVKFMAEKPKRNIQERLLRLQMKKKLQHSEEVLKKALLGSLHLAACHKQALTMFVEIIERPEGREKFCTVGIKFNLNQSKIQKCVMTDNCHRRAVIK